VINLKNVKTGNILNEEFLIGTKWHLVAPVINIFGVDIFFNPHHQVIFSDDPNNLTNTWSLQKESMTLVVDNGFIIYSGTIEETTFTGEATTKTNAHWKFKATLASKSDSSISKQVRTQTIQQDKHVKVVSTSLNRNTKTNNTRTQQAKYSLGEEGTFNSKIKRLNWKDFNRIIVKNSISTLYHFTAKANLKSIKEYGGLYSWYYCYNNNIHIPHGGGGELSRSLDLRHGVENYVRLCFTRNHPMMYLAINEGRIPNPVILEINPEVIFWKSTKFSNKNATRNDVKIGSGLEDFNRIRFDIVKQLNHFNLSEEDKPFYQAEVLVFEKIPIECIKNINDL
jgi:hypothetical protein